MTTPATFKASDIITDVLQKLGVYSEAESVSSADMQRGLVVLNDMLDQWQNEAVFVYSLTTLTLALSNGVPSYTIGPPGSVATLTSGRPSRIQSGPGSASIADGANTYPVNGVTAIEWSGIQSINPGGGVPDTLFYDAQYPVGVLNVSPTPNKNGLVMTFYALVPFYLYANSGTQTASFSQGTVDTLKDNLAVNLKPYFATAQLDPIIAARSEVSKEFLRTTGSTSRARIKRAPSLIGKPSGGPLPTPQSVTG